MGQKLNILGKETLKVHHFALEVRSTLLLPITGHELPREGLTTVLRGRQGCWPEVRLGRGEGGVVVSCSDRALLVPKERK